MNLDEAKSVLDQAGATGLSQFDTVHDNEDGTYTVTLTKPVTIGNGPNQKVISELTSHAPTVADMKASDKAEGEVAKGVMVISSLFNVNPHAVERMHPYDYFALSAVVGVVMGKRPAAIGAS